MHGGAGAVCDFNGDDVPDLTTNNLSCLLRLYLTPTNGEYFPVVTIETSAGWFSSVGGWNAVTLDPSNQPVQINVQLPVTNISTISVTDPVDIQWVAPDLYVLSGSTATLTEFDTNGSSVRSLGGIGTNPSGIGVDGAGNVYVAVTGSNQVWKFNPTDTGFALDTTFGVGGSIGMTNGLSGTNNGQFNAPYDVAVSPDGGTLSVSDSGNNRIQQFDINGNFLASFGGTGTNAGQFNAPKGLTYDSAGTLYIADSGNNRIALADGVFVDGVTGTYGTALGQFSGPLNVSTDERGVYVADAGNNRIQSFNPREPHIPFNINPFTIRFAFSTGLNQPSAVAATDNLTNVKHFTLRIPPTIASSFTQCPADDPTPAWTNMTA